MNLENLLTAMKSLTLDHCPSCGGKANRLRMLTELGFPVKPFEVLTTEQVNEIAQTGHIPSPLLEAINRLHGCNTLGVAVRSSAVGEDGKLSWAGQFTTRLFVKPNELTSAITECIDAGTQESVRQYAALHVVPVPELALVVQEMVDARVAGVLFTKDPRGQSNGDIVIEVVTGTAEQLVSGRQEPHRYYIDEQTGAIVREDGATVPALTSTEIEKLANMGRRLREAFGTDQDVEWAIEQGTEALFINQARDITNHRSVTIQPIVHESVIGEFHDVLILERQRLGTLGCELLPDVLSNQNIEELITDHPSVLAFNLFTLFFAHGEGAIAQGRNDIGYCIGRELETGFFHLVAGRPRCSIIHDAFTYRIKGVPLNDYCRIVNHYLERIGEDPKLANYPEVILYQQNPSRKFLVELFGSQRGQQYFSAYQNFFAGIQVLEDAFADKLKPESARWIRTLQGLQGLSKGTSLAALCSRFNTICEIMRNEACPHFVKVARLGFFAYARLRNLLLELVGEESESYLAKLSSGIPRELNPNLEFVTQLYALKEGNIPLSEVVERYGHLSQHELEISVPRYRDQPALLQQLAGKIASNPEIGWMQNQQESRELQHELVRDAGNRRQELEREIKMTRTYLPLREVIKFEYLKGYDALRQLLCLMAHILDCDPELLFWLHPREIGGLPESDSKVSLQIAAMRREQHRLFGEIHVPAVFSEDHLERIGAIPDQLGSKILEGIGVTDVVSEGTVVVVEDLNDQATIARLHPGAVLVTATTDPAWSPVLSIVGSRGGLVTEIGGLLAHGAIYAREMGIAAVLNVPFAARILKTGMRVRVDSKKGTVTILS